MATLRAMFACLIIALMIGTLSWVKGSSLKKRKTDGTRTQSQETDGVVRLVRNSDDDEDEDEDDNADEEEDDSAEGGRNSTFAHVVAVSPGKYHPFVGFNGSGVINGTWKVVAQNGSVNFNEETSLIDIEQDGFYSFYASIFYAYPTSHAMSHCVGVITGGGMDDERKQCATSAASYRYDARERKYYWGHSESNLAQGVYKMRRGDQVGVRMTVEGFAPETGAIAFVPEQCYFGLERK